jgi:hypothetical protein
MPNTSTGNTEMDPELKAAKDYLEHAATSDAAIYAYMDHALERHVAAFLTECAALAGGLSMADPARVTEELSEMFAMDGTVKDCFNDAIYDFRDDISHHCSAQAMDPKTWAPKATPVIVNPRAAE